MGTFNGILNIFIDNVDVYKYIYMYRSNVSLQFATLHTLSFHEGFSLL